MSVNMDRVQALLIEACSATIDVGLGEEPTEEQFYEVFRALCQAQVLMSRSPMAPAALRRMAAEIAATNKASRLPS